MSLLNSLLNIIGVNSTPTILANVTTTQKLALTPSAGWMVFDTTLGKACVYSGVAWQTITSI